MKRILFSKTGTAMLSSMLAGLIGVGALTFFSKTIADSARSGKSIRHVLLAESYAIELLEFLLSYDSNRLKAYLSNIPQEGGSTASFPLCSEITQDSVVKLPQTGLIGAKRFYRVEVVNMADPQNITSLRNLCGQQPSTVTLGTNERFLVTVRVDWKDSKNTSLSTAMSGVVQRTSP